jgi:hypothetical protein
MLYFLQSNGVLPDKTLIYALFRFYYIKCVFDIKKIQKKIQLHTLDHAQYSCTINDTSKMSFILRKK